MDNTHECSFDNIFERLHVSNLIRKHIFKFDRICGRIFASKKRPNPLLYEFEEERPGPSHLYKIVVVFFALERNIFVLLHYPLDNISAQSNDYLKIGYASESSQRINQGSYQPEAYRCIDPTLVESINQQIINFLPIVLLLL